MFRETELKRAIKRIETKQRDVIFKKRICDLKGKEVFIYKRWSRLIDELKSLVLPRKINAPKT